MSHVTSSSGHLMVSSGQWNQFGETSPHLTPPHSSAAQPDILESLTGLLRRVQGWNARCVSPAPDIVILELSVVTCHVGGRNSGEFYTGPHQLTL